METSCIDNANAKQTIWKVDSGFFFPGKDEDDEEVEAEEIQTEL